MATKEEWTTLIDQEEGEMFVLSLLDDIIQKSQLILFQKYIDIQVLPYSVTFAHQTIQELINFYFFPRDPGNTDLSLWEADQEPEGVPVDSWARACIPVRKLDENFVRTEKKLDRVESLQEELTAFIPKKPSSKPQAYVGKAAEPSSMPKKSMEKSIERVKSFKETPDTPKSKKVANETKKIVNRPTKNDKDDQQLMSDLTFDPDGRLIPLASDKSRSVGQQIKFKISGTEKSKIEAVDASKSKAKKTKVVHSTVPASWITNHPDGYQEDQNLNSPLIVDSIKLAPGVTIREGDVTKAVPLPKIKGEGKKSALDSKAIAKEIGSAEVPTIDILEQIIANSESRVVDQ